MWVFRNEKKWEVGICLSFFNVQKSQFCKIRDFYGRNCWFDVKKWWKVDFYDQKSCCQCLAVWFLLLPVLFWKSIVSHLPDLWTGFLWSIYVSSRLSRLLRCLCPFRLVSFESALLENKGLLFRYFCLFITPVILWKSQFYKRNCEFSNRNVQLCKKLWFYNRNLGIFVKDFNKFPDFTTKSLWFDVKKSGFGHLFINKFYVLWFYKKKRF